MFLLKTPAGREKYKAFSSPCISDSLILKAIHSYADQEFIYHESEIPKLKYCKVP